jgi:amino acid transporter
VFYAFVGFESGLVPAGEARNPRRDMPLALFWALGVAAVLYFGLQTVSLAVLPGLADTTRPLVEVSGALFGPIGALVMFGGMAVSIGGNIAGALFSSPRITYALGLDGRLPAWFAAVSPRFGTPAVSIGVFGVIVFALAAGGTFVWLAGLSVLTRVFMYIGCIAALPELRRRHASEPGVMRLPGGLLHSSDGGDDLPCVADASETCGLPGDRDNAGYGFGVVLAGTEGALGTALSLAVRRCRPP